MGRIYTFYSPLHGQCKTTSTAIAIAMAEARKGNDVIITHVQARFSAMENYFGYSEQRKSGAMEDIGLNNLVYNSVARELTEKDIRQAIIQVADHIYMLPALGQTQTNMEKDAIIARLITKELPKHFRSVIVDLGTETGTEELGRAKRPLIRNIIEAAAVNYVVLAQSGWLWKAYPDIPNVKYLISGYSKDSKYTSFKFRFKTGAVAKAIPLCAEYADALSDGKVREFFERNENLNIKKPKEEISGFIKAVEGVIEHVD